MPDMDNLGEKFKKFQNMHFAGGGGKWIVLAVVLLWLASGIYIVEPDEVGVVQRFGAFERITTAGPHYHLPFPIESVQTPKVTEIRRMEIGFRSSASGIMDSSSVRSIPEESLMLTGDENIVNVQFIVQYQIKDPVDFLFNLTQQSDTVKNAAEAAMREVIGKNTIDSVLTTDKLEIQQSAMTLLQETLDRYVAGIRIIAVQLQDVYPPDEVVDAFKDVASAREDKSRFINEADAYRNDVMPKARGRAAAIINEAQAYKQSKILKSQGDASRFTAILGEYQKAKDITKKRLYLETMEEILSNPDVEKTILPEQTASRTLPFLPLTESGRAKARAKTGEAGK
ncbi:HflK protein [Desulfovibrio sp. X2]|nr:HflK protein [Desulfovibrio sp. X2]